MKEIQANSGIFLDEWKVLLPRRAGGRHLSGGKWDLMGGDIQPGETPLSVLQRDAWEKLHIPSFSIERQGEVLITEGVTQPIRRHYFVCRGDYSNIILDPRKYDKFDWYSEQELVGLDLVTGVLVILRASGFLTDK